MPLTQDEIKEVMERLIRCNIDLNQGINYFLSSKYEQGVENFVEVVNNLRGIIKEIKD